MTDRTGTVYVENEIELSWPIGSGVVYDEKQQENNVIDHNGEVYTKNDIEVSWSIWSSVDCDKNKIGQLRDWSYRWGLRWKQN